MLMTLYPAKIHAHNRACKDMKNLKIKGSFFARLNELLFIYLFIIHLFIYCFFIIVPRSFCLFFLLTKMKIAVVLPFIE